MASPGNSYPDRRRLRRLWRGSAAPTAPVSAAEPQAAAAPQTVEPIGASLETATELQRPRRSPASDLVTSIDADAVVAAYEEVLGNIYDSVLPSVVAIRVARTTAGAAQGG
jgi:hypothetical protein